MAFSGHISQHRITAGVVAGIAFGIRQGILVDGDVGVGDTVATAKAAVDTAVASLHISQRAYAARVKPSLDKAETFLPGYITAGDADSIYAIEDLGTAIRGLALYL
jgi:hypothetical protein